MNHYLVERQDRDGTIELSATPNSSPFTDTTTQLKRVYRYRVRAVFSSGNSNFSNGDLATTFFINDPVNAGQTLINARYFTDLRDAVNDVRIIAGLAPFSWSQPTPATGGAIKAAYIEELRANLDPALARLEAPPASYTDPSPPSLIGKTVRAYHINELRERMK